VVASIDVLPVLGKALGVVDSPVIKLTDIECIVGLNESVKTMLSGRTCSLIMGSRILDPGIGGNGSIGLYSDQLRAGHKVLQEPFLLPRRQATLPFVHQYHSTSSGGP